LDGKDGRVRGKRRREVRADIDGGELASPNLAERVSHVASLEIKALRKREPAPLPSIA
jgi:hypothetical protein